MDRGELKQKKISKTILNGVGSLRKHLHTIPEAAFEEHQTKACIMSWLEKFPGIEVIDRGSWFYVYCDGRPAKVPAEDSAVAETGENSAAAETGENSAAAETAGESSEPETAEESSAVGTAVSCQPIAFRADFDAVEGADGTYGHYCGHDGHSAILAGFARYLSENPPTRPVYLIFQPAEEIGKGAELCRTLIREKHISEIYGFHNIPGYPQGSILILPHTFACASTGLEITITGTPSHAAYPEAGRNPAEVIARLILLKDQLLQQSYRGLVLATVIGVDLGSQAYGVSASRGTLRFTVRAAIQSEYRSIVHAFTEAAEQLTAEAGMTCEIRKIEEFPATENHPEGITRLEAAASSLKKQIIYPPEPFRWSEDFGYYLQQTSGAFFGVGSGETCPQLHTENYEFPDEIEETVLEMYAELVM